MPAFVQKKQKGHPWMYYSSTYCFWYEDFMRHTYHCLNSFLLRGFTCISRCINIFSNETSVIYFLFFPQKYHVCVFEDFHSGTFHKGVGSLFVYIYSNTFIQSCWSKICVKYSIILNWIFSVYSSLLVWYYDWYSRLWLVAAGGSPNRTTFLIKIYGQCTVRHN